MDEKLEAFNARGIDIYGSAWDNADEDTAVPIRDLIVLPQDEIRRLRIEAQNIITCFLLLNIISHFGLCNFGKL